MYKDWIPMCIVAYFIGIVLSLTGRQNTTNDTNAD